MIKTFTQCASEYGTLYFMDSGVNSYALTSYGVLVVNTKDLELHDEVTATVVCKGVAINKFKLNLTEKVEVRLYAKRKALEVPETLGGFKFGKQVFRTVTVPTSEVPVFEVSFEAQREVQYEEQYEALVGLS